MLSLQQLWNCDMLLQNSLKPTQKCLLFLKGNKIFVILSLHEDQLDGLVLLNMFNIKYVQVKRLVMSAGPPARYLL